MNRINDRNFLRDALRTLQEEQIAVWLFGGWAEELHGLSLPRAHVDIDLLYPARDFRQIDSFLNSNAGWHEIVPKRFPHKRAATVQGIMVEFFLIQEDEKGIFTRFFDRVRFDWPGDTLRHTVSLDNLTVNAASRGTLQEYRRSHAAIREAYRDYMAEQITPIGAAKVAVPRMRMKNCHS